MTSLSVLSARYRISVKSLERLFEGEGLDFDDDEFEIDKLHQKAINELSRMRMSPYVIAYGLWCRDIAGPDEGFVRYDNLADVAAARGYSLRDAISDIHPKQMQSDRLASAKYWLDRATGDSFDLEAVNRIANWCKLILHNAHPPSVEYPYLAVRLLLSVPIDEMPNYPRPVQRAVNLAIHYGKLDGCHNIWQDRAGVKRRVFYPPKFDL